MKPRRKAGFAASDGWSVRPENMTKPNDIITIESQDSILYEMIVKSVDSVKKTVTGEVAWWKSSGGNEKIVNTVTVPEHSVVCSHPTN